MRTLLLMPTTSDSGSRNDANDTPLPAAAALVRALQARQDAVTVLTRADAAQDPALPVRLAWRLAGPDAALAALAFLHRHEYDVVFSGDEAAGLWLAALFQTVSRRPAHVSTGHRLSQSHLCRLIQSLRLMRGIDSLFVHSQAQRDFVEDRLGVAAESLALIPPPVDDHFFRPDPQAPVREDRVCAAGLRWRDYATLLAAVSAMPDLHVDLAAYPAPIRLQDLPAPAAQAPPGVTQVCDYSALRALYARSLFVVVPLCEADFAAGATTILQAMAMGKAVIATRTEGQTDVIVEGVTGLTVSPGDVTGWRQAIARLREDGALRERLGRNARRWVEENAALEIWAGRVAQTLCADDPSAETLAAPDPDTNTAALRGLR